MKHGLHALLHLSQATKTLPQPRQSEKGFRPPSEVRSHLAYAPCEEPEVILHPEVRGQVEEVSNSFVVVRGLPCSLEDCGASSSLVRSRDLPSSNAALQLKPCAPCLRATLYSFKASLNSESLVAIVLRQATLSPDNAAILSPKTVLQRYQVICSYLGLSHPP